jgi:GntR family transcriptional regulator
MLFKLSPSAGQPLFSQVVQQVRHAIETGVLRDGDALPSIRTLAEELVVSPNTVVKAYSELEHAGLLEMRHGSGAYVIAKRRMKSRAERTRTAQARVQTLIESLLAEGFTDEEIHRMFAAELFYDTSQTSHEKET